jgi:hypothetical protein
MEKSWSPEILLKSSWNSFDEESDDESIFGENLTETEKNSSNYDMLEDLFMSKEEFIYMKICSINAALLEKYVFNNRLKIKKALDEKEITFNSPDVKFSFISYFTQKRVDVSIPLESRDTSIFEIQMGEKIITIKESELLNYIKQINEGTFRN